MSLREFFKPGLYESITLIIFLIFAFVGSVIVGGILSLSLDEPIYLVIFFLAPFYLPIPNIIALILFLGWAYFLTSLSVWFKKKLEISLTRTGMLIIVIAIVVSLLLPLSIGFGKKLVFSSTRYNQTWIYEQIREANYCQEDSDCQMVSGKCPLGCYFWVNRNEVTRISKIVRGYPSDCIYECAASSEMVCTNQTCQPKPPEPKPLTNKTTEMTFLFGNRAGYDVSIVAYIDGKKFFEAELPTQPFEERIRYNSLKQEVFNRTFTLQVMEKKTGKSGSALVDPTYGKYFEILFYGDRFQFAYTPAEG